MCPDRHGQTSPVALVRERGLKRMPLQIGAESSVLVERAPVTRIVCALVASVALSFVSAQVQQPTTPDDRSLVYLEGLYDTLFPSERANLNGSKAVREGGFPRGTAVDDVAVEVIEMPYPVLLYTREPDEIFVFGGTPFIIEDYVSLADGLPAVASRACW